MTIHISAADGPLPYEECPEIYPVPGPIDPRLLTTPTPTKAELRAAVEELHTGWLRSSSSLMPDDDIDEAPYIAYERLHALVDALPIPTGDET
jgi:hypothetical protein